MKRKRILQPVMALMLIVALLAATVVLAGQVYDRNVVSLATATGAATWTNERPYAALELQRIWIEGNLDNSATVTVTRITSDGVYTQAVGSVVCSSGSGSTASLTAAHMAVDDVLSFANSTSTGATAIVEYEVQQH